jgi:hypothetical protein
MNAAPMPDTESDARVAAWHVALCRAVTAELDHKRRLGLPVAGQPHGNAGQGFASAPARAAPRPELRAAEPGPRSYGAVPDAG